MSKREPKTWLDAIDDVNEALSILGEEIAQALRLPELVMWLQKQLDKLK